MDNTVYKTEVQHHEAEVMTQSRGVDKEWLTITGVVTDTLIDGQEIIYTSYQKSDGSFKGTTILQVKKQSGETRLIHREPQVMLEKLRGNEQHWKEKNK